LRIVLALVVAVMVALPASGAAVAATPVVRLMVIKDGSVQIEGKRYLTADALRPKLLEIDARKPKPALGIVVNGTESMKAIGAVILMVVRSGVSPKMGFLVEPLPNQDWSQNKLKHRGIK
jgi:hypothetical protein